MTTSVDVSDAKIVDIVEQTRSILEQAPVGIVRADLTGRLVQANPKFCEIVGRSEAELKTLRIHDITHPDDLDSCSVLFAALAAGESSCAIVKRYIRADGSFVWVNVTASTIRDSNGHPQFVMGVVSDLTEQRLAEEERKKISAEFEQQARIIDTVLSSITDFAYTFDLSGRFVYVNKALLDLWGLRLEDAVGKNFFDLKYPDSLAAKLQQQIQQVIESRRPLSDVTPYTSPTGAGGFYEYIFSPVFADDGSVELVAGSTRDISDHQNILEALRRSEESFRQLADAMPQIVWAANPDGRLDYYNRRWFEYINLPTDDTENASWDLYIHDDDLKSAFESWTNALRNGKPYVREFRIRGADGVYRWFLVRALPIRDTQGIISRWFGTCTDIQDHKELEAEKEQLLESERAARSTAEHASQMKDEFLATLSHELRTPLSAILGWTRLMRTRPMSSEDISKGLETIEKNARVQTQLIEDLLDMSRIISGKLRLDIHALEPILFVEAAIETVMPAAVAKGIRIEKVLDPRAGPISGDTSRLQQVVWNLLSNAIKFTPRDGKVQVLLARVNSQIEISVADTGQGIAADFLPRVFDRFRQADSSTSRKFGGLGLGLAIVKQLVELHGGTVSVNSPGEDQGTTFTVRLPLKILHGYPHQDRRAESHLPNSTHGEWERTSLAGLRILVVDDEPDARGFLRRFLEDSGADVITAASAAEGLAALRSERPDVLISDIGMPEVDGYEFLRRVRALGPENGGKIPAVALTALARSEDRTRALLAGYIAHVSKPADPFELAATIASIAGRTGEV